MDDIVERIRNLCTHDDGPAPAERLLDEAADEIERLRREVARLEESIAMWRGHAYAVGLKLNAAGQPAR